MKLTEKRFREASGATHTEGGLVRCQGLSNRKVNKWRAEHNDFETPNEKLWPECQCPNPAAVGFFVCKFHGANTHNQRRKTRTFEDLVPTDLRDMIETVTSDPNYMSRRTDIILLQARKAQLLDRLKQEVGLTEAWESVRLAELALKADDKDQAQELLENALNAGINDRNIWQEIYQIDRGLRDLTTTQMKTAKELKLMATAEQMSQLVASVYELIMSGAEKYIADDKAYMQFMTMISKGIQRLANFQQEQYALPEGLEIVDGEAE